MADNLELLAHRAFEAWEAETVGLVAATGRETSLREWEDADQYDQQAMRAAVRAVLDCLGCESEHSPVPAAVRTAIEALREARACAPNRHFWVRMNAALQGLGEEATYDRPQGRV